MSWGLEQGTVLFKENNQTEERKYMSTDRKVLVVTGASQGLGEGFVKAYKERGWRIVGNSRSIKPSNDPDYITVSGDVGDPAIARKVVQTALDRFGRVDTLINNAGIWRPSAIATISEELYRRVMATNVDSVFFATQVAVPAMQNTRWRSYHPGQHESSRARASRRASSPCFTVERSLCCRDSRSCDGTRQGQHPSQCRITRYH